MTVSQFPTFAEPVSSRSRVTVQRALAAGVAAIALLGGCSNHMPHPDRVAQKVHSEMDKGQAPRAIALAETSVKADGRNAALREVLANAYLRAGRFESARQAYADAIELGDDSSRAAIGLVMADLALGHNSAALDTINTYGDVLPAADLGLALAMAGQSERGIGVLTTAIRQGQNVPKVRQNLAYAYALAGMWGEARVMAGQDIPANQVDARVQAWAALARPEDARRRIAGLIGAPVIPDNGQPEALALANFPANGQNQSAQVAAPAQAATAGAELAPSQAPYPSGALARIDLAPASSPAAPAAPSQGPVFVQRPVVQPVAAPSAKARSAMPHSAPVRAAAKAGSTPVRVAAKASAAMPAKAARGTHLVQLGAFNSQESARRAWHHFVARNPALQGHPNMITKVTVRGHDFWRVQAAGFTGQASAASLCSTLRSHGGACLVMAVNAAARVSAVQTADARPKPMHASAPAAAKGASPKAASPKAATVTPAAAHPAPAAGKVNATRR